MKIHAGEACAHQCRPLGHVGSTWLTGCADCSAVNRSRAIDLIEALHEIPMRPPIWKEDRRAGGVSIDFRNPNSGQERSTIRRRREQ